MACAAELSGDLLLNFVLDSAGLVTRAELFPLRLNDTSMGRCVLDAIGRWRFAEGLLEQPSEVSCPLRRGTGESLECGERAISPASDALLPDGEVRRLSAIEGPAAIDLADVGAHLRAHQALWDGCYAKATALTGEISIQFDIEALGGVGTVLVDGGPKWADPVFACIRKGLRSLIFPATLSGSTVRVRYPFLFRSNSAMAEVVLRDEGATAEVRLPKAEIRRAFGLRGGALRYCHEKVLAQLEGLQGLQWVEFDLDPHGRVAPEHVAVRIFDGDARQPREALSSTADASPAGSARVEALQAKVDALLTPCVADVLSGIEFPHVNGEVHVRQPFFFRLAPGPVEREASAEVKRALGGQADTSGLGPPPLEAQIEAVFQQHRSEVEYCRAKALLRGISISARPSVEFEVAADGAVARVLRIESGALPSNLFDACLREYLTTWTFPALPEGGLVRVAHAIEFGAPPSSLPSRARRSKRKRWINPLGAPLGIELDAGEEFALAFEKPRPLSLTESQVAEVVERHLQDIYACFDREKMSGLSGESNFTLRLTLGTDGSVKGTGIRSHGLPAGSAPSNCLFDAMKKWRFPEIGAPASEAARRTEAQAAGQWPFHRAGRDQAVQVSYPFEVKRLKKARAPAQRPKGPKSPDVAQSFEIVPLPDEISLDATGARHWIEHALMVLAPTLRECRSDEITLSKGPHHPIPLYFEIAPDGRVLEGTIALGVRTRPSEGGGKGGAHRGKASETRGHWRAVSASAAEHFERCIARQVKAWKFAPNPDVGKVSVRFPVSLASQEEIRAELDRQVGRLHKLPGGDASRKVGQAAGDRR